MLNNEVGTSTFDIQSSLFDIPSRSLWSPEACVPTDFFFTRAVFIQNNLTLPKLFTHE
jgi:hypothetical protein